MPALDPAVGNRIGQRQRDRGRRGVAVAIDRDHHFFRSDAELVRGTVDDALIGLVRHEPIDIGSGVARRLEGIFDDVGDHRHGVLEHLAALHAQMADCLGRRWPTIDIKLGLVAAVRPQMAGQDAPIALFARLQLPLHHHGAGAVAEQHAGGAVAPVQNAREGLSADHQGTLGGARFQHPIDHRQRVDKARADRLEVECGTVSNAEPRLHGDGRRREGLIRRRGGDDDQVDA